MEEKSNQHKNGYYCNVCGHLKILYYLFKSRYCLFCKKNTNNAIYVSISDTIRMRESLKLRHKRQGFGKFISETINGWFPNILTKDSEYGVDKQRIVDRGKNEYHEVVKDLKTGKIIRDCHEPLDRHKSKKLIEK